MLYMYMLIYTMYKLTHVTAKTASVSTLYRHQELMRAEELLMALMCCKKSYKCLPYFAAKALISPAVDNVCTNVYIHGKVHLA